ncbi:efflux RND transporter periplasmic adaptor subunit [Rothia sp. p3-SID1597]|nr:efflux RND transporter periplasmic adaptor subunit [Rothia sp. p3-SID1597]
MVLTLAVSSVGSFALGLKYKPQGPSVEEQVEAVVPVWAKVERRVVSEGIDVAGNVEDGTTADILSPRDGVLTRRTLSPGDQVASGDLLGVINGEPIYGLDGPLPLYRDLALKDSGDDVLALQRSLSLAGYPVAPTGTVTREMLRAVEALYRSDDLPTSEGRLTTIPHAHFVSLPDGKRQVVNTADVATTVGIHDRFVVLRTSEARVKFRLPAERREQVTEGTAVDVQTSRGRTAGAVQAIGSFDPGTEGIGSGYDVTVTVHEPSILVPGQSVSVHGRGDRQESLAVPLTAVRQEGSGTFVEVEDPSSRADGSSSGPPTRRVEVKVLRRDDGYAAVSGGLEVNQRVQVQ